ncbi:tumor necrosis factor receptor superfamily member 6 [Varanus komodoensis]|uniref:Tumor necrosis factor receptor superfamily member 6 n=1 Tax=Varanus komodoensis TaxID=61221 RepID=A0A8D2IZ73_VARKO|nr:tumor necrosis factor receptor superfamily member 6 [Varanus komodoensis]
MQQVLFYLLALHPALVVIAAGVSHSNAVSATCRDKDSKQDLPECQKQVQYCYNGTCCNSCPPGSFATKVGCTKEDPSTSCQRCIDRQEYMDHFNYQLHCLRCGFCDSEHGMEVEKPCNIYQNEKCKCMPGFFCNSSRPCTHCDRCDKCEYGTQVVENCTQTRNTKCAKLVNSLRPWAIASIVVVIIVVLILVAVILYCYRKKQKKKIDPNRNESDETVIEVRPLQYPDVNLNPYIPDIAEDMKLKEVRKLVRKLGVSPADIDAITHDHQHDCSEQKIKLLEHWYQRKGEKNAYFTLITTLRSIPLNAPADNLEDKVRRLP